MRNCLIAPSLAALLLVVGCNSSPPPPPPLHPLEQNAMDAMAMNLPEQVDLALAAALTHFESLDDLEGQWRIRYQLVLASMKAGDTAKARMHLEVLQSLAQQLDHADKHFATLVQSGRVLEDITYYERAGRYAANDIDRAVVAAYAGNTAEAMNLITAATAAHAKDRAFVYYRHAQSVGTRSAFNDALAAYRDAGDSRGVADALVSLARIESGDGNVDAAMAYGARATRVLTAMGDAERASSVRAWLESL